MYNDQQNYGYGQQGAYGADGQYYYYPPGGSAPNSYDANEQPQQQGQGQSQEQGNFYPSLEGMGIPGLNNFNPMISGFAQQYGENLVDQGKQMAGEKLQRFVTVSKLKYYFAVDTAYVMKKMGLLFFPYTHKNWSIRFDKNEDDAVQPRFEVNAPDLYIPLMAFITYILVAGVCLGTQQKFSPEMLGIQASSALGWLLLELMILTACTYVIQTDLKVLDLLTFCSYKFVGMIFVLISCIVLSKPGYYAALGYFSLSLSVFLIRTLKVQINNITSHDQVLTGNKRRAYFMLTLTGIQPVLMWVLTYHLTQW